MRWNNIHPTLIELYENIKKLFIEMLKKKAGITDEINKEYAENISDIMYDLTVDLQNYKEFKKDMDKNIHCNYIKPKLSIGHYDDLGKSIIIESTKVWGPRGHYYNYAIIQENGKLSFGEERGIAGGIYNDAKNLTVQEAIEKGYLKWWEENEPVFYELIAKHINKEGI